jgi:hypothetical protein
MHYTMAAPLGKKGLRKNWRGEVLAADAEQGVTSGSLRLARSPLDNESEKRI